MPTISINSAEIIRKLNQLAERADNLSAPLTEIGELWLESTKQRFSSGIGPDGQPWADNAQATIDRKGGNKPLLDGGTLLDEIDYQVIGGQTLEFGSDRDYAAMQQFGGKKSEFPYLWGDIPARPFLGLSDADVEATLAIIEDHLKL